MKSHIEHRPHVATTEALPASTFADGVITGSANGAICKVAGISLAEKHRLYVCNEVDQSRNGHYIVTQVGDESHPFILTRSNFGAE